MLGSVETSASIIWVSWWLAPNVYFRERTLGETRGEIRRRGGRREELQQTSHLSFSFPPGAEDLSVLDY